MWGCSNHSLVWWSTLQAEEIDPQLAACFIVPILWRCVDLAQQKKLCFQMCVSKINSPAPEHGLVQLSTAGLHAPGSRRMLRTAWGRWRRQTHEGGGTQDVTRQVGNLCSDSGDGHSPSSLPTWWRSKAAFYMAISVPPNSLPWQAFCGKHITSLWTWPLELNVVMGVSCW